MAASFIYGVDGAINIGSKGVAFVTSWSMNIGTGVVDTPELGSSGPKRVYSKYKDFTGSLQAEMRFDPNTTATVAQEQITAMFAKGGTPAALTAKFVESSQSMWSGSVVFTNISKNTPAEGLQSWSADWAQSTGPLTHATAT